MADGVDAHLAGVRFGGHNAGATGVLYVAGAPPEHVLRALSIFNVIITVKH